MNGHWHAPLCMDKLINYFSTLHLEMVALLCAHLRTSAWKKATWVPGKGGVNQVLALYLEIVYTVTYKLLRNIRKSREIWKISFHSIFVCCYVRLSMEAYRKHKEVWVGPWWVWGCDVSIRTALLLCQLKAAVKTASIYQQPSACGGISWTQTFVRNMVIISNMMCSFHAFSDNYIFMSTVCLSYTVHFLFNPNKALFQMETETAPVQQRWVWLSCKKLMSYISVYLTVVGLFSFCFFGHTETSCKQTMISSSSSWYG